MSLQVTYRYKAHVPDEAQRRSEGMKVKRKFPAKIPGWGQPMPWRFYPLTILVVGKVNKSDLPELERSKFLFPATAKVGDLSQFINVKMSRPEQAPLFVYVDNEIIVSKDSTMAEIYQEHRENDYFLYLAYYEENIYASSH